MPHLGPLDALRARLLVELAPQKILHAQTWGNPRAMTEALHVIKRELGGNDGGAPPEDLLQLSLQRFGKTLQVGNFTELKYVCYGVTVPVGKDQWRVIDKRATFDGLLDLVKGYKVQPKQFRRCYQGLLSGYLGFDWYSDVVDESHENWECLRGYLSDHLKPIVKAAAQRGTTPEWLRILNAHKNLLTSDPCSRYAKGLKQGDTLELKEVCIGLGIIGSSWVWQDALMAYVELVCAGTDANFVKELTRILDLVDGRSDIPITPSLAIKATAMVVIRYCACTNKPEHAALRDTCLHWIGNPWLKRTAWDAHVNNEPARQMVDGWLKRRLIQDFFELLAQDGSADLRRLNYWLKWAPQITDMWFVLGTDARGNRSEAFMELRKRMLGRDRALTDNNHQNNAFVMRIGPLLVIEFGVTGNACYAFAAADFKTSLEKPVFSINELKQRALAKRLSHRSAWESEFDNELTQLLHSVPMSKGELKAQDFEPAAQSKRNVIPSDLAQWTDSWRSAKSTAVTQNLSSPTPSKADNTIAQSSLAPTVRSPSLRRRFPEPDFNIIRRMCVQHDVEWKDDRFTTGDFWILIPDRKKKVGLSALLDRNGFQYDPGKGFWLKNDEGAEKSPASVKEKIDFKALTKLVSSHGVDTSFTARMQSPSEVTPASFKKHSFTHLDFINLRAMCRQHKIEWEDNRPKRGALWVLLADRSQKPGLVAILDQHGFHYAEGKGFWRKDEA